MQHTSRKQKSYRFGHYAEHVVVWYLRLRGYVVLARRYKSPFGEVDIIVRRGKTLVFVEVKARRNVQGGDDVLSPRQRERITRSALAFVSRYPRYADYAIRFDLVILTRGVCVQHIRHAWEGEGN